MIGILMLFIAGLPFAVVIDMCLPKSDSAISNLGYTVLAFIGGAICAVTIGVIMNVLPSIEYTVTLPW